MASDTADSRSSVTRRTALRTGAGILTGGALTSTVSASHQSQSDSEDTVTTTAAINASAPTFGADDYVGIFVQIVGEAGGADQTGVKSCSFLSSDDEVATFDVQFLNLVNEDRREREGVLFTAAAEETVSPGQLYVINNQEACGGSHYQVQLEQVGASKIRVAGGEGGGSSFAGPGFGPLAALAGLGLGALGYGTRRGRED